LRQSRIEAHRERLDSPVAGSFMSFQMPATPSDVLRR
jgi:hypothetical protein